MLRTLFKSDFPAILTIENAVHVAPWTEETFKTCFQSGCQGWVIELDNKIIGFIIVSFHIQECHILNVCIVHEYQHRGWGRQLLEHALKEAKKQGIKMAYLEVRRSNSRAISLYKKMDFRLVGERKNYYPTVAGYEDALIFAKQLNDDI